VSCAVLRRVVSYEVGASCKAAVTGTFKSGFGFDERRSDGYTKENG
jgi:hypothetical protein